MKFRWKPPFIASSGQFDLNQTNPNVDGSHKLLFTEKHIKCSYRSLRDYELFSSESEGSNKFKNNQSIQRSPAPIKSDGKIRDENYNVKKCYNQIAKTNLKQNKNLNQVLSPNNDSENKKALEKNKNMAVGEKPAHAHQKRVGVSAGSTDEFKNHIIRKGGNNGRIIRDLPKYQKSTESEELIKNAILNNEILRKVLGDKEVMQAVVDAMYLEEIPENNYIIMEGAIGQHLYVCAKGLIDVYKEGKKVNTLGSGRIFGELALLYNERRNATIKAIEPCILWVLDREVFNHIVRGVGTRRIEEHVKYLRSVPILCKLENDVLIKMTDLLKVGNFTAGTPIIRQGEEGNLFYIITMGTVTVTVKDSDGTEKIVVNLGKGDFFGERALLAKDKRVATVTALTRVECLTLDREPFMEFLGGLTEVQQVLESRAAKLRDVKEKVSEYSYIRLEELTVVGTLGVGGFGTVELVQYKKNRSLSFALKKLKKSHIVEYQQEAHVLNEKRTMLCCHSPFIAKLHNTYKDNKYLYFLMEACLGGDVWTLLQKQSYFDDKTAKFISACVVEAFHYLHDRGIVYRDLKPENLLFDAKGYVKLVDFGFAKKISPTEKTWTFAGTPEYLAPEIVLKKGHDRAVDYWALGVFIYELLVGKPPFRGDNDLATYDLILKGISYTVFPKFISKSAECLIKKLCKNEATGRLGYQKEGIQGIKEHKWFLDFNWRSLEKTEMKAPYVPRISGPVDLSNFEYCSRDKEIPPDVFGDWDMKF